MLGLELCECEAVLQSTCNLQRVRALVSDTCYLILGPAWLRRREGNESADAGCTGGWLSLDVRTLLTSARLSTLSTTSSGCFFHGDDMVC